MVSTYIMKYFIGLILVSVGFASVEVRDKFFPGHLYRPQNEGDTNSDGKFQQNLKQKYTHTYSTPERPAGDRLFIDGDTGVIDWNEIAGKIIENFAANDPEIKYEEYAKAKNVILFVGSGMGPSTVSASRIYSMQSERIRLAFDSMPTLGLSRTYSTNAQVTDAAASATAIMCGEKNKRNVVGLNQKVQRGDCNSTMANKLESFLKKSVSAGKWTGIVSTGRVTHATSASAYAHAADREWESDADRDHALSEFDDKTQCPDIAAQLVDDDVNKNIRVVLGGGRRNFMPDTENDPEYPALQGRRKDSRNLHQIWLQQKPDQNRAHYVWNSDQFNEIDPDNTDYLMGLFEPSHMHYELDRAEDEAGEPSLPEMVEKAIRILSKSPDGFFLIVAGARISHAHAENLAVKALAETVSLSKAVKVAHAMTNEEDTLIIATADHSHPVAISGYPYINNDITGLARVLPSLPMPMLDLKPFTTLIYANGPGFLNHRTEFDTSLPDRPVSINDSDVRPRKSLLNNPDVGTKNFMYDASIYRTSGSNAGEDVGVYASGPMSRMFTGVYEQNYIAHAMMYASCVGDYADRIGC